MKTNNAFDIVTHKMFLQYEAVRQSGVTNMFNVRLVMQLSGLKRPEITDIMKNYGTYADKWL